MNRFKNSIAMKRRLMVHLCSSLLDLQVVNEYPKSGGTWIGQLVADSLDIPFPRNQMPKFSRSLMHGHYLSGTGMKKPIVVWRDGRDVMTSLYYHSYFKFYKDQSNHSHVNLYKQRYPFEDYDDVSGNMPKFIEQQFVNPLTPRFSWSQFVSAWIRKQNRVDVYYEKFRVNPESELYTLLLAIVGEDRMPTTRKIEEIVSKYDFDKIKKANAAPKGEHSFVRAGATGGWREDFSDEAKKVFLYYAERELLALGYPLD